MFAKSLCLTAVCSALLFAREPINSPDLSFQAASGEWQARGAAFRAALQADGAEITFGQDHLLMRFAGATVAPVAEPIDLLPGKVNYLVGADPSKWVRRAATYRQVAFREIYRGIDLIWYGNQNQLEYDLVLQPGAEPNRIAIRFEGAKRISLTPDGAVAVALAGRSMNLRLPTVYQDVDGVRTCVRSSYWLSQANEVRLRLGEYDRKRQLIIDPVLAYAAVLSEVSAYSTKVANDEEGNVYLASEGGVITPRHAFQSVSQAKSQIPFVAKYDRDGKTLLYETYVGGTNYDQMNAFTVTQDGRVTIAGQSQSADFPLKNAVQTTFTGEPGFVTQLNKAGDGLEFSTYLGSGYVNVQGISTGRSDSIYVAGFGPGNSLPATLGPTSSQNSEAFAAKFGASGALQYLAILTTVQGSGRAIAVDDSGAAYVTGTANGPFLGNPPGLVVGTSGYSTTFIAKIDPAGQTVPWVDEMQSDADPSAMVRDRKSGTLFVAGSSGGANLPVTANAMQPTPTSAFLLSLKPDGSAFNFITYFGGSGTDTIHGLAVTHSGQLAIVGDTTSGDFPLVSPIQSDPPMHAKLYASHDGGNSWTPRANTPAFLQRLSIDPTDPSVILGVATSGIARSSDGGQTWTTVLVSGGALFRDTSHPQVVYAAVTGGSPLLYKSSDGGGTWAPVPSTGQTFFYTGAYALTRSPKNPNVFIILGWGGTFRSTDGGATFTNLGYPSYLMNLNLHPVWTADGTLLLPSYSGVYGSTDNGATFLSYGFNGPIYAGGIAAAKNGSIYVSDCIYAYELSPGGSTWTKLPGVTPGFCVLAAPLKTNHQILYAVSPIGDEYRTTNDGKTWTAIGPGLQAPFISEFLVAPSNELVQYTYSAGATVGFLAVLNESGTRFDWSTYYGGVESATLSDLAAIRGSDELWATGNANGTFPVTALSHWSSPLTGGVPILARFSDESPECSVALSAKSRYAYETETMFLEVTAPSGCDWKASASEPWIQIRKAGSGVGTSTVAMQVLANTTAATRTGALEVNGEELKIIEPAAGCSYAVSPSSPYTPSSGGDAVLRVKTQPGCKWDAITSFGYLRVESGHTGAGPGTVTIAVEPNSTYAAPYLEVIIAGQHIDWRQQGACSASLPQAVIDVTAAPGTGTVNVTSASPNCGWVPTSDESWLHANQSSYSGSGSFPFTYDANTTGSVRVGHIRLSDAVFTVTQSAK